MTQLHDVKGLEADNGSVGEVVDRNEKRLSGAESGQIDESRQGAESRQIDESRQGDESRPVEESVPLNTVERHAHGLLDGEEQYSLPQAAELAGLDVETALRFWLAMGFPTVSESREKRIFTDGDVEAMRLHAKALRSGLLTHETLESLNRAQSHMSDRLVLWQHEVLVDYARRELGLDGISARFWVLDNIIDYEDYLRRQMEYSWRRHMVALLRRSETEVSQMELTEASDVTLRRAFGFIDMVAFTNRSNELGSAEFIELVELTGGGGTRQGLCGWGLALRQPGSAARRQEEAEALTADRCGRADPVPGSADFECRHDPPATMKNQKGRRGPNP